MERGEAYRFYCYCPASSYEECVQKLPGPEDKGPAMNEAVSCGDLVARSLDGATCETSSEDINGWAQTCCVDKTSICPVAQLCKNEDPANFVADAMYEYRCSAYSGTEAFTSASCPEGCHAGEDDKARDQAYRFYCSCPASSYDECVQKLPGPEDKGPLLNQGSYCSDLVARSLDGATCETRRGDIDHWAQTCCMDKTSLCSGVWISPPSLCTNASV